MQQAPDDDAPNRVCHSGDNAAERKQAETKDDYRQAPDPVRQGAEGYLEARLGQAVGTDGEPDQERRRALELSHVQGQHRQQRKQAEHAQHGDHRDDTDGALFLRQHRGNCVVRICLHPNQSLRRSRRAAYISRLP